MVYWPQSDRVTKSQTHKVTQYTEGWKFFVPDINKLPYSLHSQGNDRSFFIFGLPSAIPYTSFGSHLYTICFYFPAFFANIPCPIFSFILSFYLKLFIYKMSGQIIKFFSCSTTTSFYKKLKFDNYFTLFEGEEIWRKRKKIQLNSQCTLLIIVS